MDRNEALAFAHTLTTLQKIRLIHVLEGILHTQEDDQSPEEKASELLRHVRLGGFVAW